MTTAAWPGIAPSDNHCPNLNCQALIPFDYADIWGFAECPFCETSLILNDINYPTAWSIIGSRRNPQPRQRCHLCSHSAFDQVGDYWLCNSHYLSIIKKLEPDNAPVIIRRSRATGTQVSLYREGDAGEPTTKWATVCEDHGGIVYHETKAAALSELSHPEDWCPDCQDLDRK